MSTPQMATFKIDVPYMDQDGTEKVRKCVLTLSVSIDDQLTSCAGSEEFGEISVQGPVMPVGNPDPGATSTGAAN